MAANFSELLIDTNISINPNEYSAGWITDRPMARQLIAQLQNITDKDNCKMTYKKRGYLKYRQLNWKLTS